MQETQQKLIKQYNNDTNNTAEWHKNTLRITFNVGISDHKALDKVREIFPEFDRFHFMADGVSLRLYIPYDKPVKAPRKKVKAESFTLDDIEGDVSVITEMI